MENKSSEVSFDEKSFREVICDRRLIGKGGFGEVYGPCTQNGKDYAIKKRLFGTTENDQKETLQACITWKSLNHRNLVSVFDVSLNYQALYVVMEFARGGSLKTFLATYKSVLPLEILKDWGTQIAEGMAYLHREKIVHRDLKSPNILIMEGDVASNLFDKTLKITDFDQVRVHDHTTVMSCVGTYAWMAPEVITEGFFSKKSDAWSYGVVLWEMLTRTIPHKGIADYKIISAINEKKLILKVPDSSPELIKKIICRCQKYLWTDRPCFEEILLVLPDPHHPLLKQWAGEEEAALKSPFMKLPLELVDIILLASHRYYVSRRKQRVVEKDGFFIQKLASVDFCFYQRLTKRRFKHRIWNQLSAFYQELDIKVAIHRNNYSYIAENILITEDMVKHLRSVHCLSDVKALALKLRRRQERSELRLRRRQERSELRLRLRSRQERSEHLEALRLRRRQERSELLEAVRILDDAKLGLSTFIECLRRSNQKRLAQVEENGGVVIKTELHTLGAKDMYTKLTVAKLLHQSIKDLLDRTKPRSHETDELISQLKEKGIEIVNSQLNRRSVVVWIWCRSQAALQHLHMLYESKELRDVLFENILQSIPRVIVIDSRQFKKTVVVRQPSVKFIASLDLEAQARGVTKLGNEIYVLCRSDEWSATEIFVFEDQNAFLPKNSFQVTECELSCDIVSCEKENCLYISDLGKRCIWKIKITQEKEKHYEATEWLTGYYKEHTMSTSIDGEILIVERGDEPSLFIYGSEAEHIRIIQLPNEIKCPHHAVESSIGNYLIIGDFKETENEELPRGRGRRSKWGLFHVTRDGEMVLNYTDLSSEMQDERNPRYFSVCSDDRVFVAASKVILLDFDLKSKLATDGIIQTPGPKKLFYDEKTNQLIVCGMERGANVYSLIPK